MMGSPIGIGIVIFVSLKSAIARQLPIESDAIHIYIGLISFLLGALLFRSSLHRWRTLLVPLAIGLAIEIVDGTTDPLPWSEIIGDGVRDMLNTMIVPFVITVVARRERRRVRETMNTESGKDER